MSLYAPALCFGRYLNCGIEVKNSVSAKVLYIRTPILLSNFAMAKRILLFALLLLSGVEVSAQYAQSGVYSWKQMRHSVGFGLGVSAFLGELGGRDQIGTNFIHDLETSQSLPALFVNYRYQFFKGFYGKGQFMYTIVRGNDALTEEIFRHNRNIHFKSNIFEFTAAAEYEFIKISKYRLGIDQKPLAGWSAYITAGLGVTLFNPKSSYQGKWYELQPLGTEGQYQEDGPTPYSLSTMVIPIGGGIRYEVTNRWTVGLEVIHRITFSDYIDDVSTVYYNNDAIRQSQGELAAHFADPSLGYYEIDGDIKPLNSTAEGMQRGDNADDDAYFVVAFTASYRFAETTFSRGRHNYRRKRRVSF